VFFHRDISASDQYNIPVTGFVIGVRKSLPCSEGYKKDVIEVTGAYQGTEKQKAEPIE
jgi:hypothetical protein